MLSRQALFRFARVASPQRPIVSQIRTFAAASASGAAVKPPVALFGLDGTYATALVRSLAPTHWHSCDALHPSFAINPLFLFYLGSRSAPYADGQCEC